MAKQKGGLSQDVLASTVPAKEPPKPKRKSNLKVVGAEVAAEAVETSSEIETEDTGTKKEPKWGRIPRQSYYVPKEIHKAVKMAAIENELDPSDIVVEGIQMALKKMGAELPAK